MCLLDAMSMISPNAIAETACVVVTMLAGRAVAPTALLAPVSSRPNQASRSGLNRYGDSVPVDEHPPLGDIARRMRTELGALALRSGKIAVRRPSTEPGRAALTLAAARRDELSAYLAEPLMAADWTPTPFQEMNLINELLTPSSDAHLALVLAVPKLPGEMWQAALGRVAARHELLRTRYFVDSRGFRAVTSAESALDYVVESVSSSASPLEFPGEVTRWLDEPFDLSQAVGRVCLFRSEDDTADEDLLAIVIHHVAADYRGLEVLAEDLEEAVRLGDEWQPHAVEAHYLDFAAETAWAQRQPAYDDQIKKVVERLRTSRTHVSVAPVDGKAPPTERFPIVLSEKLDAEISAGARKLAAACNTTVYTVVLEAVSEALSRISGVEDFVLGCAVSCRDRPEWSRVIGDFVNLMPVAVQHTREDRVRRIERLKETLDLAFKARAMPFSDVVTHLRPTRVGTSPPLCQIAFTWHRRSPSSNPDTQFRPLLSEQRGTPSDLLIAVVDDGSAIEVRLHARGSAALRAHLDRLLSVIVSELRGAPEPSAETALVQGDAVKLDGIRSPAQCLAKIAGNSPGSLAYVGRDGTLTYKQLADRVAGLAGLIEATVPSPARVAVLVGRTEELVVAEMAASWLGAAFVPIDPEWPDARVRRVLEASDPDVLIADGRIDDPPAGEWATMTMGQDIAGPTSLVPFPMPIEPDAPAYLIFTSGSSGKPKGVEIPASALANFVLQMRLALGLGPQDRVAAFASCGFDASIFELVAPIMVGATIVLAPEGLALDTSGVLRFLRKHDVSLFPATPSLMRLMLEDGWDVPVRARVVSMGEALEARLASRIVRLAPELWDLYGPTEATVWATAWRVPSTFGPGDAILLGYPLANSGVAVLDESGRPSLPGVVGELCVFGAGLATGYYGRPDLTAAAFKTTDTGLRYYRTGDLASQNARGEIRLHGRSDLQVKVSGHRLELGEVESALLAHDGITHACVVAVAFDGHLSLAALVETSDNLTAMQIRRWLQRQLPQYAVPSRIQLVSSLPLTSSGKVDRQRAQEMLTQNEDAIPAEDDETNESTLLRAVWREVLGHNDFSSTSDFFAVGGTSLQAINLAHSLNRRIGLDVRPQGVFTHPVFAEQLAWCRAETDPDSATQPAPPILPEWGSEAIPPATLRPIRRVLLTGATGFLGAHVTQRLADAGVQVLCLVRAESQHEAARRLASSLTRWGIDPEKYYAGQVRAFVGDLDDLPFSGETRLPRVDAFVHCAANVNLLLPQQALHQVNVESTLTLARAAIEQQVPFHFVSTYSVLDPTRASHGEEWGVPAHAHLGIPYVYTKWEAEELLAQLRERGASIAIYRPSRVIGSAATGASNEEDLFNLVLGCVRELGCAPDLELTDNFIPVDEVAEGIASRILDHSGVGQVHNMVSPRWMRWSDHVALLNDLGHGIARVSLEEWQRRLRDLSSQGEKDRFRPLQLFVEEYLTPYRTLGARHPTMANRHADPDGTVLGRTELDAEYLNRTLDWMAFAWQGGPH